MTLPLLVPPTCLFISHTPHVFASYGGPREGRRRNFRKELRARQSTSSRGGLDGTAVSVLERLALIKKQGARNPPASAVSARRVMVAYAIRI